MNATADKSADTQTTFASDGEAAQHEAAMDALATELQRSVAEIKPHYESVLVRLQDGARVRDFLSVCAMRHLREKLRTVRR